MNSLLVVMRTSVRALNTCIETIAVPGSSPVNRQQDGAVPKFASSFERNRVIIRTHIAYTALALLCSCKPTTADTHRQSQTLDPAVSLRREMRTQAPLVTSVGSVPIISEEDFQHLLERDVRTGPVSFRVEAAKLAAQLTSPVTLGVFGRPERGHLETPIVIVARDWLIDESGFAETRDFYVAVADLSGDVTFTIDTQLALTNTIPTPSCTAAVRGCRPTNGGSQPFLTWTNAEEGGLGLPLSVTVNFESPPGAANASRNRPSMRIYGRPEDAVSWNEFTCHEEVMASTCANARGPRNLSTSASLVRDLRGVSVVRESELLRAISEKRASSTEDGIDEAVLLATQGNSRATVGIEATIAHKKEIDAPFVIVLRDWGNTESNKIEGSEWYVFHGRLHGSFELVGIDPGMLLREMPLGFDTIKGPCGLGSIPTGSVGCGPLRCMPKSIPTFGNMNFGSERWINGWNRVSIRFAIDGLPTRNNSYLCSEFLPTTDPATEWCRNTSEICNGIDDNCNRVIDEGVCEVTCK